MQATGTTGGHDLYDFLYECLVFFFGVDIAENPPIIETGIISALQRKDIDVDVTPPNAFATIAIIKVHKSAKMIPHTAEQSKTFEDLFFFTAANPAKKDDEYIAKKLNGAMNV